MKSLSSRVKRALLPLGLFALYATGQHFLQTASVDQLSVLSDAALVSLGRMRKPYGIGINAFKSYIRACKKANVSPQRISQTIGYAKASARYHTPDGVANERKQRININYTCALDISVRGLSLFQIHALVAALHDAGYVAWFRTGKAWKGSNHIHAVFLGYPMKPQLRSQYRDAISGKDGLAGHRKETFYTITAPQKRQLSAFYNRCSLGKVAPKPKEKLTDAIPF